MFKKAVSLVLSLAIAVSLTAIPSSAFYNWFSDTNFAHFYSGTPRARVGEVEPVGGFDSSFVQGLLSASVSDWNTTSLPVSFVSGINQVGAEIYLFAGRPDFLSREYNVTLIFNGGVANGVASYNQLTYLNTYNIIIGGVTRTIRRVNPASPMNIFLINKQQAGTFQGINYGTVSETGHANTTRHELGHALGFRGHNMTTVNLMNTSISNVNNTPVLSFHRGHITQFRTAFNTGSLSFFLAPYFAFFSRDTQKVSPLDTYTTNQKIENMLERYGYNDNIIIGKPIEIILGDENEGVSSSFGDFIFIDYLFQVTNNLTGNELPEFITVRSQLGTIFEIGKEYCISPMHINNALWDSHTIHSFPQFIPAEHLSRGEINRLKNAVWSRNDGDDPPLKVAESASLSPEFISSVDLAVEITVLDKLLQSLSTNVFNVNYELNNILHGEEYGHILTDWLRINTDVEVGGTYIVLLNVIDNAYTHPAARSGVVISKNSPEFAEYKKAFSS